jgi:hypothetical protein
MPSLPVLVGIAFELFICLAGLIIGDWRGRTGSLIFLATLVLEIILKDFTSLAPLWRYLMTDTLCLAGFVLLCWKSPHPWPLWVSGVQLMNVCISLVAWQNSYVRLWAYYTALTIFGYAALLVFGAGLLLTLRHRRQDQNKVPKIG